MCRTKRKGDEKASCKRTVQRNHREDGPGDQASAGEDSWLRTSRPQPRQTRLWRLAKELKDEKILKEYIEKAEDLPHLAIEPLKFGPVLKALGEEHPAEFSEIFRVLKAADAAIEKSELFKEIGKAGSGESDAEAQVYAKARAMVAKDGELTFDDAVCKVLEDDKELYTKYEDERQKTVKRRGK